MPTTRRPGEGDAMKARVTRIADTATFDPVTLEIQWSRLAAFADEAASTLLRTAFSTIIRESNDYTIVVMNRAGETVAECSAGIPAFAALMSPLTRKLLERFPVATWREGDRVVTNDPWIGIGHLPDLAMVAPIFHRGALVGFTGTAAHLPDIGGTPSMGRTELIAEGLLIPPTRLYRGGELNEDLATFLLANVRLEAQVWGDIEAQVAANETCRRRVVEFLADTGLPDLEDLSRTIHAVTDAAVRRGIAALPDGVYTSTVDADGVPGQPTRIECRLTVAGESIDVDYTGTTPQVPYPTNCTLQYTRAYTINPLKLLLATGARSNHGSYRAITVSAPEGSILNTRFPAPVLARHLTGHLLSSAVYQALAPVLPGHVIADSGGAPAFRVRFAGTDDAGEPFAPILFASAGMGASAHADGLSTTAFPTNSGGGSVEALEAVSPLLFTRKEFRPDSAGAGTHRGGLGQIISVQNTTGHPLRVALLGDREHHPPRGVLGGSDALGSAALIDGVAPESLKSMNVVPPGGVVDLFFAGGAGFGPPEERDPGAVADDVRLGYVTAEAAARDYPTYRPQSRSTT